MLTALLKARIRFARLFGFFDTNSIFLWAGAVGVAAAFTTIAFRDSISFIQQILTGHSGSLVAMAKSLPWHMRLILPAAGGLVAGLLLSLARRYSSGAASDYMEAIGIGDGRIPVRQTLLRSASSLGTIATGGSIGREGSMVQLAALCASALGRFMRFDTQRLRLLVACGAAAGITSAYNTPLAGAFFITEIVLGSISMVSFGPVVVASVVANMTMRAFPDYRPAYEMPEFPLISGSETLLFALMGAIAGLVAPQFLGLLDFSKRQFQKLPLPLPLRLALGGLLVGAVSIWVPQVWGNGYSVVNSMLHEPQMWSAVLIVLLAKIVATALTTGSGAVGGVFTPTLFVGAALGWLFGSGVDILFPGSASAPFAYAAIGMGAFLSATAYAPLMAILMIFEMTLNYQAVLPLMLACVVSYLVARSISDRSMYEITRKRNRDEQEWLRLRGLQMRDLIRPPETVLPLTASFAELTRMFFEHPVKYIYIVDEAQRFQGVVALQDLASVLSGKDETGSRRAADFLRRGHLHVLTPGMSLGEGLQLFMQHQGERLPVVESMEDPVLLGVVYKTALLDACFQLSRPNQ
ncbi:ClcB-like voltage-gated chloride channel protein [Noviherbaspirillum massiliense]|uniref:ClcB-like voltage-gated chloride channel protein n=1 Tax=Noviherbaspirillum massiliense TaxID=1465823 RepID=UPI0002EAD440|nr:ClcB-like voltage-gated chloride channel protein [Noviherbaspirillum massiliense]